MKSEMRQCPQQHLGRRPNHDADRQRRSDADADDPFDQAQLQRHYFPANFGYFPAEVAPQLGKIRFGNQIGKIVRLLDRTRHGFGLCVVKPDAFRSFTSSCVSRVLIMRCRHESDLCGGLCISRCGELPATFRSRFLTSRAMCPTTRK